jgi:hypothetical protein
MAQSSTNSSSNSRAALKQQIKEIRLSSEYFIPALQEAVNELKQNNNPDDSEATGLTKVKKVALAVGLRFSGTM